MIEDNIETLADELLTKIEDEDLFFDNFDWLCEQEDSDQVNLLKKQQSLAQVKIKQKLPEASLTQVVSITPGNKLTEKEKGDIQKTLAEKFITKGFGYIINKKAVKKRHKIIIDASYYNNTMSSIVRKTFRTLQNYLLSQCRQQNIKPLSHSQGSLLRSPMLQCTKWLKKEELETFYKFICRAYELKKVYINEDQASRLYGQIIQSAHKGHEVSHIILHRTKKKSDHKNNQGLVFSYAPSNSIAKNATNNQGVSLLNKFIQH